MASDSFLIGRRAVLLGGGAAAPLLMLPGDAAAQADESRRTGRAALPRVPDRAALAELPPSAGAAVLGERGREGVFVWSGANHSSGARPIAAGANLRVSALAEGWHALEKISGGTGFNAVAASPEPVAGPFLLRFRRHDALPLENVSVGLSASPGASANFDMMMGFGVTGSSIFIYRGHAPGAVASRGIAFAVNDVFLHRDAEGRVRVYSGLGALAVTAANIGELVADGRLAVEYEYPGTIGGEYRFDSALKAQGSGARVQLLDLAGGGDGLVAHDSLQGIAVAPAADPSGAGGAWLRDRGGAIQARWFGAAGDGRTNDTAALRAASRILAWAGGGTLELEPKTYLVGEQTLRGSADWAWKPEPVIYVAGCTRKATVRGNGCTLKCAPGLRYGQFDPRTGAPSRRPLPFAELDRRASPIEGFVFAERNSGDIEVEGVNVDGDIGAAVLGGEFGDAGRQIGFDGFRLIDNSGRIAVRNCRAVRCGLDGIDIRRGIDTRSQESQPTLVENFEAAENGRQGGSFVGARMLTVINSKFNRTGKNGALATSPSAGVDVEPDAPGYADEILFLNCEAIDNAGIGFGYATGRNSRCVWKGGRLIGTTNWALWVDKPGMTFEQTLIVGAFVPAWNEDLDNGVLEEGLAPRFVGCDFSDNPARAPEGRVYQVQGQVRGALTWFRECVFNYRHTMRLPETPARCVFENCRFHLDVPNSQTNANAEFRGLSVFTGRGLAAMPYLSFASMAGRVTWNGVELFAGEKAHDWGTIPPGASAATVVEVPGARPDDRRVYQARMSGSWRGLAAFCEVTAPDRVTVRAVNSTRAAIAGTAGTLTVVGTR